MKDAQVSLILGHPVFKDRLDALTEATGIPCSLKEDEALLTSPTQPTLVEGDIEAGALIIYTSGTTGQPKGAVSTHRVIDAQTSVLVKAWYWSSEDRIHHILPLHHIHGIINALICPLYAGATVEMHPRFDTIQVWSRWADLEKPRLTVFMSVPTVYAKLQQHFHSQPKEKQIELTRACQQFRFMVSGSASLPTSLRNHWRKLSGGQVLLERYGMTGKKRKKASWLFFLYISTHPSI